MKKILSYLLMGMIGLLLGVLSRIFDLYTDVLGSIFSGLSIWILLCTLIVYTSKTKIESMARVFLFCAGMLIGYYFMAIYTKGVYGINYIYGWSVIACISPILALIVYYTKKKGRLSTMIKIGMIIATILGTYELFDTIYFFDWIITALLGIVLFKNN